MIAKHKKFEALLSFWNKFNVHGHLPGALLHWLQGAPSHKIHVEDLQGDSLHLQRGNLSVWLSLMLHWL